MTKFDNKVENWFCESLGTCFQYSVNEKIDSYMLAEKFLNERWGNNILLEKSLKELESPTYMLDKAILKLDLKRGKTYDEYLMWMYGYLIKYWTGYRNIKPLKIWEILPIDRFNKLFSFYHTQGWDYIIDDSIKRYKGLK